MSFSEGIPVFPLIAMIMAIFCTLAVVTVIYDGVFVTGPRCDELGPGYEYSIRFFFIGEPKCVFIQEFYDREMNTVYLNEVN